MCVREVDSFVLQFDSVPVSSVILLCFVFPFSFLVHSMASPMILEHTTRFYTLWWKSGQQHSILEHGDGLWGWFSSGDPISFLRGRSVGSMNF